MARYSFSQLAGFARAAGFPSSIANTMAAIALAESGGNSGAYNPNARTGDLSYGLWQINMIGAMGPQRRRQFGISSNNALFDPRVNARAAYAIYRQQGLRAWSVYKSGSYRKFVGGANSPPSAAAAEGATGGGGWVRPVSGGKMTNPFGKPNARYKAGHHTGMDWFLPRGAPVYAASAGRVVRVTSGGAYGKRIEIEHAGKLWTLYAHLDSQNVRVGQKVNAGQMIGRVGSTGTSTAPHLHFEVRRGANAYRNTVNPANYINGRTTPDGSFTGGASRNITEFLPLSQLLGPEAPPDPEGFNIANALFYSPVARYTHLNDPDWDMEPAAEGLKPAVGVGVGAAPFQPTMAGES